MTDPQEKKLRRWLKNKRGRSSNKTHYKKPNKVVTTLKQLAKLRQLKDTLEQQLRLKVSDPITARDRLNLAVIGQAGKDQVTTPTKEEESTQVLDVIITEDIEVEVDLTGIIPEDKELFLRLGNQVVQISYDGLISYGTDVEAYEA